MIQIKHAYEPPQPIDGTRFLVDRVWLRRLKRESLQLADWRKEVAPSDDLRRWFGHKPERWNGFLERYFTKLDADPEVWRPLLDAARPAGSALRTRRRRHLLFLPPPYDENKTKHMCMK
jgi:uncharacterized protein YeaO (DUF488 family)